MSSEDSIGKKNKKMKDSKNIAITAFITIVVAIVATWFTLNYSKEQAVLAEAERVRNVRDSLVSIIEEHIINQKPINYIRLVRLIELKSRTEKLVTKINTKDLIEQAEYNILISKYLDFNQKEKYMVIFDQLHKEMTSEEFSPIKDIPQAELLNKLARNIQERKIDNSLILLKQYVESVTPILDSSVSTTDRVVYLEILKIFLSALIVTLVFIIFIRILYIKHLMRKEMDYKRIFGGHDDRPNNES